MQQMELSEHFQALSSAQILVFWPVLGCCGPSPSYVLMTELSSNIYIFKKCKSKELFMSCWQIN